MSIDPKLQQLLNKVFAAASSWSDLRKSDPARYKELRHDFVFHMTDWLRDLEKIHDLYEHPEKHDPDEAYTFIIGFLYHVIPHLNAAGRLLLDEVSSPFKPPTKEKAAKPRKKKTAMGTDAP